MEKLDLIVEMIKDVKKTVDKNSEHLSEMRIDVELNRKDLQQHMLRTDQNETIITKLDAYIKESIIKFQEQIDLIKKKMTLGYLFTRIVVIASGISTIVGVIYGIIKLVNHLIS